MTVRESLKETIRSKGLLQKYVAEKSGIGVQQLYAILNGYTKLTVEDFCRLCQTLEADPSSILGYPWTPEINVNSTGVFHDDKAQSYSLAGQPPSGGGGCRHRLEQGMNEIETLEKALHKAYALEEEVLARIPQSTNPMLESGKYRGEITPNANGGYDFHAKYFYTGDHDSGTRRRVPFKATIRDLPRDSRLEKSCMDVFLTRFDPWGGEYLPLGELCTLDLWWAEVADLYADGKIEIEGRDAEADAKIAERLKRIVRLENKISNKLNVAVGIEDYKRERPKRVKAKMLCGGNCANCACVRCYITTRKSRLADECACCTSSKPGSGAVYGCASYHT